MAFSVGDLHHYGVKWCAPRDFHFGVGMRREGKKLRTSISFSREVYEDLERIAEAKKVSLAWVVREATEKYIHDQWPLLDQPKGENRA